MRLVAAIPAAGLLGGCAVGLLLPDSGFYFHGLIVAAAIAGAVPAWRFAWRTVFHAFIVLGFFSGGALLAQHAWQLAWRPPLRLVFEEMAQAERTAAEEQGKTLPLDDAVPMAIIGRLRADASPGPAGVSLSIDVRDVWASCPRPASGGVLLTVGGALARERIGEWRAGRLVRVSAQLRRPSRYLNPGAPDEERALARRGTTLVGSVKSGALVDVVENGHVLAELAAAMRAFVRRTVASTTGRWSVRAAAIVTAILIGDRTGLDAEVERDLQDAGTYHVVAISGGNIAIFAALLLGAFRIAGWLGRTAMFAAIAGLLAYGYLVGGSASVTRATLTAVVYLAARAIDLRGPPLNTLAVVAGLIVAVDPLAVADPGFLLTFGATLGILFAPSLPVRPTLLKLALSLFVATVAAELLLLPVAATFFARVTVAGLVLNFAAIPMMAVAQIAGMVTVVAATVSDTVAAAAGWVAFAGAEGLVRSAALVRVVPQVSWRVAAPHWIAIVAYYALVATAWRAVRRGSRWRFSVVMSSAIAALWIALAPLSFLAGGDGRLHVTFVDVGQGDAAIVRFPRGRTIAVDAGGLASASAFDVGDRVVAPMLRRLGIRRLDTLVITHGDADHAGGAAALVREFRPRDVWEGIPVPPFEPLRALRAEAERAGSRWVNVQTNDLIAIDDVELSVRHPGLADWERQDVRNDDSVVLELRWGDVSVVLTGDIGREVEERIAVSFPRAPLRVVKVPHHGSLTSSSQPFVDALAPRVAVVSAGRSNPFGHPAAPVLERYRAAGAEIFRTDLDGAVMVETDGREVRVRTVSGHQRTFSISTPADHK